MPYRSARALSTSELDSLGRAVSVRRLRHVGDASTVLARVRRAPVTRQPLGWHPRSVREYWTRWCDLASIAPANRRRPRYPFTARITATHWSSIDRIVSAFPDGRLAETRLTPAS